MTTKGASLEPPLLGFSFSRRLAAETLGTKLLLIVMLITTFADLEGPVQTLGHAWPLGQSPAAIYQPL